MPVCNSYLALAGEATVLKMSACLFCRNCSLWLTEVTGQLQRQSGTTVNCWRQNIGRSDTATVRQWDSGRQYLTRCFATNYPALSPTAPARERLPLARRWNIINRSVGVRMLSQLAVNYQPFVIISRHTFFTTATKGTKQLQKEFQYY